MATFGDKKVFNNLFFGQSDDDVVHDWHPNFKAAIKSFIFRQNKHRYGRVNCLIK